jgi:hypothetical protein
VLAVLFGISICLGAIWGVLVKAPARPPLSGNTVPLYQGASNFADSNGKPVGLAQFAQELRSFRYDVQAAPETVVSYYDTTLGKMGFYLIDSANPTNHSYVRENENSIIETLHIYAAPAENGKTTVAVSLEARPRQ